MQRARSGEGQDSGPARARPATKQNISTPAHPTTQQTSMSTYYSNTLRIKPWNFFYNLSASDLLFRVILHVYNYIY